MPNRHRRSSSGHSSVASRRKKRRRARLIGKIVLGVLLVALLGAVIFFGVSYFLNQKTGTSFLHPFKQETGLPGLVVNEEEKLPDAFASDLVSSVADTALDSTVTSVVAVCYDRSTGEVVYSESANKHMPQASITKMMTFYVVLQEANLEDTVIFHQEWMDGLDPDSSLADLKDGDCLTIRQLLYGMMMPSGNDAATALAHAISGSEEAFADLMNAYAHRLAMTDSHFVNPHGLHDDDHYTSAYDIYLLFDALLDYDVFREVITTQNYTADFTNNGSPRSLTWSRKILYFVGGATIPNGMTAIGGKTGTTDEALLNLAFCAKNDATGDEFVCVVLRSGNRDRLYANMNLMLEKAARFVSEK